MELPAQWETDRNPRNTAYIYYMEMSVSQSWVADGDLVSKAESTSLRRVRVNEAMKRATVIKADELAFAEV